MIEFFIRQYKAVNLIVILVIALGVNYFINGQKEVFPAIGLDIISIFTTYPGASADEVDALVTQKIEDAIDGIEGRKRYTSTSSEGLSIIVFEVDPDSGIDVEEVTEEIKNEVDLIKSDLPADVKDPIVREISFGSSNPAIEVVVTGNSDLEKLKKIVREFEDDVKAIEEVGKTDRGDYQKTQIWIKVDPQALKENNIEIQEVVDVVKSGNINIPAGSVDIEDEEILIKTIKKYQNLDEIKNRILRINDAGKKIYIKDIAEVSINYEELSIYTRINRENAYRVLVYQKSKGDVIKLAKGAKALIEDYKKRYDDVTFFYTNDISFYVERRLRILSQNATIGLLLVFLCLILFFDFKITFWTTMGIPFSFCLSIIVTYNLGISINMMSMFGFIVVIGMIVDDAIIISENIYRRRELGEDIISSAITGAKEMFIPILAITATTVAAFLPLVTLPGVFGKVLGILPQVVIVTMIASFVECLFVLPGHIAGVKNKNKEISSFPNKDKKKPRAWFYPVRDGYGNILLKLIRNSKKTFLVFLVFCILIVALMIGRIPFIFFPSSVDTIDIRVETKINNGLGKTEKIIDEMEKTIREKFSDNFIEIISLVGSARNHGGPSSIRTYKGTITLSLNPENEISVDTLNKKIREEIEDIEGIEKLEISTVHGGPPQGNPIEVVVLGKDIEDIKNAADELEGIIKKISNTTSVQTSFERGKDEIEIEIDEEKAGILSINILNISKVVRTAFEGNNSTSINSFQDFAEEVDVLVKYDEGKKESLADIRNLKVKNAFGERIPLKNFSKINFKKSSGKIDREDGAKYLTVTGQFQDSFSKDFNTKTISKMLNEKIIPKISKKYPELNFKLAGADEKSQELNQGVMVALALALFGVFFILTSIFKSYIQPLVVMVIIPFSFVGVVIGLFLNNEGIGLMPFLGMVALIGVVVNDSLVMVDFINRLRTGGMQKEKAIIEGSKSRLRPILMTSITTVVGLSPLAYGVAGSEPFLAPMALSFLWGLMFSTIILVLILPTIYSIVDDFISWFYKKILKKEYVFKARAPIYLADGEKVNL